MKVYITFDGPPGDNPSAFLDVEDENGQSLSLDHTGAAWQRLNDNVWALGPFVTEQEK